MKLMINKKDITIMVGTITLDGSLDTLGEQLNFDMVYSNAKSFPVVKVGTGAVVQLFDDDKKEVFRGIVVTKNLSENNRSYTCFDYAFYLNKSKAIKQFTNVQADIAITQLLKEFEVPIGKIASMNTIIKKVYYDKEISAIIKDILDEVRKATGAHYVMEMQKGKLYIHKAEDLKINCKIKLYKGGPEVDVSKSISAPSRSESIEEMKNSIQIYSGTDNKTKVVAVVKNSALVSEYGLLQETQSIDQKDIGKARNIANNLLKELGQVMTEGTAEVLGNFDLRVGRIIVLEETQTGLVGSYKIKSVSHSIGTIHTTSLDLQEV